MEIGYSVICFVVYLAVVVTFMLALKRSIITSLFVGWIVLLVKLTLDLDSEVGLNRQRQALAKVFRGMTTLRSREKTMTDGGIGYRFNSDGNQVPYCCDAKQVVTIDFDRHKIRALASSLGQKADALSIEMDKCLVNTEVDYVPPFDLNDSFDTILTDFMDGR